VRASIENDGYKITDLEILRTIKERGAHPLFLPDLSTLRNSVAKGRSDKRNSKANDIKK
jgi:hypothetical protein